MDPWVLWIGVFWLVVLGGTFVAIRLARPRNNLNRISKAVGLPITDELRPTIESWERRDLLSTAVGAGGGLILAFVALIATRTTGTFTIFWSYFLVLFVTIALGAIAATARNERRRQQASVRLARAQTVTRDDYQSGILQWTPRITVGLLVVGLIVRALITSNPARDIPVFLVIYAAASVATLILGEWASNWIVGRGQPAGSELELAWDDAFKSRSLYTLTYLPAALGAFGGEIGSALAIPSIQVTFGKSLDTISLAPIVHSLRFSLGLVAGDTVGLFAITFLLIVLLIESARKFQQRYLRRLWPDLVPGSPASGSVGTAAAPTEA